MTGILYYSRQGEDGHTLLFQTGRGRASFIISDRVRTGIISLFKTVRGLLSLLYSIQGEDGHLLSFHTDRARADIIHYFIQGEGGNHLLFIPYRARAGTIHY
jgi:hypothetical protein